jgi:hypothetical protein
MANEERADNDATNGARRRRGRDAVAAAGGLAAGGIAQREALGNLTGDDDSGTEVDASLMAPAGISEASLDVFDDLEPAAPAAQPDAAMPDTGLPSLSFAPEPDALERAGETADTGAELDQSAPLPAVTSSLPQADAVDALSPQDFDEDEAELDDDDLDPEDAPLP